MWAEPRLMVKAPPGGPVSDRRFERIYVWMVDTLRADINNDAAMMGSEPLEALRARLADGTYGLSVESGEPIPDGRLEALPTAERTVAEEERLAG